MVDVCGEWFLVHFVSILAINIYNNISYRVSQTIVNSQNIYSVSGCVCVQVCMCSSVGRNPLEINLHVWFYFIVFLSILGNTCKTCNIECNVLLSLSASC